MAQPALHRFEQDGKRFVIDPESCFCFECDAISWDVISHFPHETMTRIIYLLKDKHPEKELAEVLGELEWLRATKAILQRTKLQDLEKLYQMERGLKRLTVVLGPGPEAQLERAGRMLIGRAGEQQQLYLDVRLDRDTLERPGLAASLERVAVYALDAGKELTIGLCLDPFTLDKLPAPLQGHGMRLVREWQPAAGEVGPILAALRNPVRDLKRLAPLLLSTDNEAVGELVLIPGPNEVTSAIQALADSGILRIRIDVDGPLVSQGKADLGPLFRHLKEAAWHYAQALRSGKFYRLEPFATIFHQIYMGAARRRSDGAGLNELALGADGTVYPGPYWLGLGESPVSVDKSGALDMSTVRPFEDVGSLTTPACMHCWARNVCGGGSTAVHQALTRSWRSPDPQWCEAQRDLLESAVAAFNVLSSEGVNFSRLEGALTRPAKLSWFRMARAAFRMQVGLRPIAEGDASLLQQWEEWNGAAYFSAAEHGVLLTTQYDREMDALHPRPFEQEFLLLRKTGAPLGLLRLRPAQWPGVVYGALHFRDKQDYHTESVRKSFKFLLEEAGAQQQIRRLQISVGPDDEGLGEFLAAIGFRSCGKQRESLYLHRRYHDLEQFVLAMD